ncbi:MAG TPA: glycosyltransferase family A protein [Thermoanaerobaculia bacterium]|jgi:glycosyltransferase involved in cell wall biosynthesis|nr:glycosyltransferase family A protein [Thermoanaerobaculia bacterium]
MTRPAGDVAPRISVIIATFNRAHMLRCAIRSVLAQDFTDFELLVVGDRCTDESSQVVASFDDPRVQWLNRDENCGSQWGPNNDGIARARGELIAFLGHDDLWLPWHLSTLLPLIDAGADLSHPIIALLAPGHLVGVYAQPPNGETYATTFIPPSGWLVRKSVLQSLGGFRDHRTTTKGTDHDLLARLFRARHRIVAVPRLTVLKFPSQFWRAYAADAAVPQEEWLAKDPFEVERQVLTDAVVRNHSLGTTAAFFRAVRSSASRIVRRFFDDDGILTPLLRARHRRQFEARKLRRGL